MQFPAADGQTGTRTRLVIDADRYPERLPTVRWVGAAAGHDVDDGLLDLLGERRGSPLLVEHAYAVFDRPGLRGHRLADLSGDLGVRDVAGRAWSTAFQPQHVAVEGAVLSIEAVDKTAGLTLRTEVEALPGGALRARHRLTNLAGAPYLLDALEVTLPLPDGAAEILDFTGRHEGERAPQRHAVADGMWLRESRRGKRGWTEPASSRSGQPVSGSVTEPCSRCPSRAAATPRSRSSAAAPPRRRSAPVSCSSPENWCSWRAKPTRRRGSSCQRRAPGSIPRRRPCTHGSAPCPRTLPRNP